MKYIKISIFIICFLLIITITKISYCSERKEGIENFPDSYKPYLLELQKNILTGHLLHFIQI